jgi:hypothetical protein
MDTYDSLKEAIDGLQQKGYVVDFDLKPDSPTSIAAQLLAHPEQFTVDASYRFEGKSNPDDSSVVYAISSGDGRKGILVDAYGMYSEYMTPELAEKLKLRHASL